MMALYPKITSVFSIQGNGKTWLLLPVCLFCISIYQKTTDARKQRLQKTVSFEKKRIGSNRFKV